MANFLYRNQMLYELLMLLLYRRHYPSRFRSIAQLIPAGSSVLDVCCGPAVLYHRYLKKKCVRYTGFDVNENFVMRARAKGIPMIWGDLAVVSELPHADFV